MMMLFWMKKAFPVSDMLIGLPGSPINKLPNILDVLIAELIHREPEMGIGGYEIRHVCVVFIIQDFDSGEWTSWIGKGPPAT